LVDLSGLLDLLQLDWLEPVGAELAGRELVAEQAAAAPALVQPDGQALEHYSADGA
jgi:hypothetical protein